MARVTADQLELAATWLESYDRGDEFEDEAADAMEAVAAWLRAEVARRQEYAEVRKVMERHGVSAPVARKAWRVAVAEARR